MYSKKYLFVDNCRHKNANISLWSFFAYGNVIVSQCFLLSYKTNKNKKRKEKLTFSKCLQYIK